MKFDSSQGGKNMSINSSGNKPYWSWFRNRILITTSINRKLNIYKIVCFSSVGLFSVDLIRKNNFNSILWTEAKFFNV